MKQKYTNIIIITILSFFLISFFIYKELVFNTISFSLNIWVKTLIPTLFPMFTISDILISYNITSYLPKKLKLFFSKLFNISENAVTIFLLSLISGFPSSARNVRKLYDNKQITKEEASHILSFTHFANPLFIIGTIGLFFFNNKQIGLIILISHYLANIIIGILFRNYNTIYLNSSIAKTKSQNFGHIFTSSIKASIDSLLLILGITTCFLVATTIISNFLNLNNYYNMLLQGLLEITMGLKLLSLSNLSILTKIIISTSILSFGGFSIHMQVISQIDNTDISYKSFFKGRIYQTILSVIISCILYLIIN